MRSFAKLKNLVYDYFISRIKRTTKKQKNIYKNVFKKIYDAKECKYKKQKSKILKIVYN